MAMTARVQRQVSIAGKTYNETVTISGETQIGKEVDVGPARSGTLTTRTDNDTGTLTLASGHGIQTGDKIDIYWTVAGVKGQRRNVTVGTVSVNSVPIDVGSGDNLPVNNTPVIVCKVKEEVLVISSGQVIVLAAGGDAKADMNVVVIDDGPAEIPEATFKLEQGGIVQYDSESGYTSPVAGDNITKVRFSHAEVGQVRKMRLGVLLNT